MEHKAKDSTAAEIGSLNRKSCDFGRDPGPLLPTKEEVIAEVFGFGQITQPIPDMSDPNAKASSEAAKFYVNKIQAEDGSELGYLRAVYARLLEQRKIFGAMKNRFDGLLAEKRKADAMAEKIRQLIAPAEAFDDDSEGEETWVLPIVSGFVSAVSTDVFVRDVTDLIFIGSHLQAATHELDNTIKSIEDRIKKLEMVTITSTGSVIRVGNYNQNTPHKCLTKGHKWRIELQAPGNTTTIGAGYYCKRCGLKSTTAYSWTSAQGPV